MLGCEGPSLGSRPADLSTKAICHEGARSVSIVVGRAFDELDEFYQALSGAWSQSVAYDCGVVGLIIGRSGGTPTISQPSGTKIIFTLIGAQTMTQEIMTIQMAAVLLLSRVRKP